MKKPEESQMMKTGRLLSVFDQFFLAVEKCFSFYTYYWVIMTLHMRKKEKKIVMSFRNCSSCESVCSCITVLTALCSCVCTWCERMRDVRCGCTASITILQIRTEVYYIFADIFYIQDCYHLLYLLQNATQPVCNWEKNTYIFLRYINFCATHLQTPDPSGSNLRVVFARIPHA